MECLLEVLVQKPDVCCVPHSHLLRHPKRRSCRGRTDPQRPVCPHAEHHQWEDISCALVLVIVYRVWTFQLKTFSRQVRLPRSCISSFHRLQDHHHILQCCEVQSALQDGKKKLVPTQEWGVNLPLLGEEKVWWRYQEMSAVCPEQIISGWLVCPLSAG